MNLLFIVPIYIEDEATKQVVFSRIMDHIQPVLHSQTTIKMVSLPKGSKPFIKCRSDAFCNARYSLEVALENIQNGIQGICIGAAEICGEDLCREVIDIPVVGSLRPALYSALNLAGNVSIITLFESEITIFRDIIASFCLGQRHVSTRVASIPASSLINDHSNIFPYLVEEAIHAIELDGAESIIFGCAGFVEFANQLQNELVKHGYNVPVIDPNRSAINYLECLVLNQHAHSRITYPKIEETIKNSF